MSPDPRVMRRFVICVACLVAAALGFAVWMRVALNAPWWAMAYPVGYGLMATYAAWDIRRKAAL